MYKNSMRMFMASSAFAAVVASVAVPIQADAAVKVFKDIPKDHVYYKEISEMASKGIINGYETGHFKPNELITRQHAASLLYRAYNPKSTNTSSITDMSKTSPHYKSMEAAVSLGWLEAPNGKSRPTATITRGEMAIAISKAATLTNNVTGESFNLRGVSSKYNHAVSELFYSGVTTGYDDGTFRENSGLTRAHYSVFVYRALENEKKHKDLRDKSAIGKSYIGSFPHAKVPLPPKYKGRTVGEVQDELSEEYEKLVKEGAAGGSFRARTYANIPGLERISKYTTISQEDIMKYADESAKTGEVVYFKNSKGTEYFLSYLYEFGNIAIGTAK